MSGIIVRVLVACAREGSRKQDASYNASAPSGVGAGLCNGEQRTSLVPHTRQTGTCFSQLNIHESLTFFAPATTNVPSLAWTHRLVQ